VAPLQSNDTIDLIRMLLARLERVSVDSYWAHRASGVRGTLLRCLESLETGEAVDAPILQGLIQRGFLILQHAAEERC
jgi:hypothetical protein